jgi:AraC-like DNA-binding protein
MPVLLDTDAIRDDDRQDAIRDAMAVASVPASLKFDRVSGIAARMELCELSGSANLFTHQGTGIRLNRTQEHVRASGADVVALAIQTHGLGRFVQGDVARVVRPSDLVLVDLTRPYEFAWVGNGSCTSFQVDLADIGLSVETVRRASGALAANPALYRLLVDHLSRLRTDVDTISRSPSAAEHVGAATIQLARALITAAADDPAESRTAATLVLQILSWIRNHLSEVDLTPARVAAAHEISVRQLYNIWPEDQPPVGAWIIQERLVAAHAELARCGPQGAVTTIAHRWGFNDGAHFSRRFRATYGISPRAWRDANTQLGQGA